MIDVVELQGPAYERGAAAGRRLAPQIRAHLDAWLNSLAVANAIDGETYAREFLRDTDFRTALDRHAPDLLEEVRGVAHGAELDPDLVFALQLMDEEWAYRARRRHAAQKQEKCSSLALVFDDGPTWIGQNMDLPVYTDGYQVMLRLEPGDGTPGALLISTAGLIALLGVNTAGLGVCVNSLPQLPSAAEGIPVAFMIRKLLQARSLAEAADWVQTLPHATNQHYLIAEPGAVRSFEACSAGVTEYFAPNRGRIFHTNHPLGENTGQPETERDRENSQARLNSLVTRLADGEPGLDAIQAALSSFDDPRHPVCRVYDPDAGLIGFTTGSMISALRRGAPIESWVSPGPPSPSGYTHLTLEAAP